MSCTCSQNSGHDLQPISKIHVHALCRCQKAEAPCYRPPACTLLNPVAIKRAIYRFVPRRRRVVLHRPGSIYKRGPGCELSPSRGHAARYTEGHKCSESCCAAVLSFLHQIRGGAPFHSWPVESTGQGFRIGAHAILQATGVETLQGITSALAQDTCMTALHAFAPAPGPTHPPR